MPQNKILAPLGLPTSYGFSNSVEILVGFELDFFVHTELKVGGKWEWEYKNKSPSSTGESQLAKTALKTDPVGQYTDRDILYDTISRTFAYRKVPPPTGATAGSVSSPNSSRVSLPRSDCFRLP